MECLYCGQVLVASEGWDRAQLIAAAAEHDQACGCNPLVVQVRRLEEDVRTLTEALKPYDKKARWLPAEKAEA